MEKKMNQKKWFFVPLLLLALIPAAHASGPGFFNYDGRLFDDATGRPSEKTVQFIVRVFNPSQDCLLREEISTATDLHSSDGYFSVHVGQGARHGNDPNKSVQEIF